MVATPSRQLLALSFCHRNRLGRVNQAVPDLLEELEPIGDAEALNVLAHRAHGRILRFSFRDRNQHLSVENAHGNRRWLSEAKSPPDSSCCYRAPSGSTRARILPTVS